MDGFLWRSAGYGACVGLGIMAGVAIRIIYSVTAGHRWYQLRDL